MSQRAIHVVGDRFAGFTRGNPDVLTITELEQQFERGELTGEVDLILGQGIQPERVQRLQELAGRPDTPVRLTVHQDPHPERAERPLTHKHFDHNVMISMPEKVGENRYEASLLVDDQCAEMSDHVTGRHIQGMVLAEAARQMALAVVERFFRQQGVGSSLYYVFNKFEVTYHSFAFPVRTRIECHVLERKTARRNAPPTEVVVCMYQGGELIADGHARFATYDANFMKAFEADKARKVLNKLSPEPRPEQG